MTDMDLHDPPTRRWIVWMALEVLALLMYTGVNPYERSTWFMEVAPIFIAAPFLIRSWKKYPLTSMLYEFIAVHEPIEWRAAVSLGQGADAFLGTQGDPWDTQEDMATALVGALVAMIGFARWQDRQMATLPPPAP